LRLARILAGDHYNFVTKDAQSTDRNIFQVPDRCRDDVERARQALQCIVEHVIRGHRSEIWPATMPHQQSNEEAQQYVRWNPYRSPYAIELKLQLLPRLIGEIAAAEKQGIEIGGVLLGSFTDSKPPALRIEEFELVPRNADNGQVYMLDAGQRQYLAGVQVGATVRGLSAIGFFRSHLRPGPLRPSLADRSLLVGQFKGPAYAVLLVEAREPRMGAFFLALNGQLSTEPAVQEFRFGERALRSAAGIQPGVAIEQYDSDSQAHSGDRRIRKYGLIAILLLIAAGTGVLSWPLLSGLLSSLNHLDLAISGNDHVLKISWNHGVSGLGRATDASLFIADGTNRRMIQLGQDELKWGAVEYEARTQQIHVTLTVDMPGSTPLSESADWDGSR
jgi:proteasome lid subunit RPN8/RPN11